MNPAYKAYLNHEYDRRVQYKDDVLTRKPASTASQREALRAKIAERKANGTLGKVPFVLRHVSKPVQDRQRYLVELEISDGITTRVLPTWFADKTQADTYATEMHGHIGEVVNGGGSR